MDKDELLKQEVEEYISYRLTEGTKDFAVYKVQVGENAFAYVVECKNDLSFVDWIKMYEGTEQECYRVVGYLDATVNSTERIEKLEKENELFKKANEIIAQQRDGRDADISLLESRIEELEKQIEKMKNQKVFLLQRIDSYDNSIDKQFYTTDEELAKEWNNYYKRNYYYGQAIELEDFSDKERIKEELESD